MWCAACGVQHAVHAMCSMHHAVRSMRCAVCGEQFAACGVQRAVCSMRCAACSVQCAACSACSVQCILCIVHCALGIVHCALGIGIVHCALCNYFILFFSVHVTVHTHVNCILALTTHCTVLHVRCMYTASTLHANYTHCFYFAHCALRTAYCKLHSTRNTKARNIIVHYAHCTV